MQTIPEQSKFESSMASVDEEFKHGDPTKPENRFSNGSANEFKKIHVHKSSGSNHKMFVSAIPGGRSGTQENGSMPSERGSNSTNQKNSTKAFGLVLSKAISKATGRRLDTEEQ